MYAVYHGPAGLAAIARRVHRFASVLAAGLRSGGVDVSDAPFFDTITVSVPGRARDVVAAARLGGVNLRLVDDDTVSISCDEATTRAAPDRGLVGLRRDGRHRDPRRGRRAARAADRREFLTHPVFTAHHSETAMLRYLRRLADRDYALDRGMIPLGLVHDEAQRDDRDGAGDQPRLRAGASVRAVRSDRRLPRAVRRPRALAGRDHRLRRDLAAAQRRLAGRVRRAAGDPQLPPLAGRRGAATSA